jgi:hypothetical protein
MTYAENLQSNIQKLTIVDTGSKYATKVHTLKPDGTYGKSVSHNRPMSSQIEVVSAANIHELHEIVNNTGPHKYLIYGLPQSDLDKRGKPKKYYRVNGDNFFPHIDGVKQNRGATPRLSSMIDVDGVPFPDHLDETNNPEDIMDWYIHEHMPECFHDVTYSWQFSSSYLVKSGIRAHIFFFFDRPIPGGDLTDYFMRYAPTIDLAPLRSDALPHYVAAPIFTNTPDPVSKRNGIVEREYEFATIPEIDSYALRSEAKALGFGNALLDDAKGYEEKKALIGDGEEYAGFHYPVRQALWTAVRDAEDHDIDEVWLKADIREAIEAAPNLYHNDLNTYTNDAYLDDSIRKAKKKWVQYDAEREAAVRAALDADVDAFYPAHDTSGSLEDAEKQTQDIMKKHARDTKAYWAEVKAVAETNAMLEEAGFCDTVESVSETPDKLMTIDTGVGKSREARLIMPQMAKANPNKSIVYLAPRHKLNAEQSEAMEEEFKGTGLVVRTFRGRGADNPARPTGDPDPEKAYEKMCFYHEDAALLTAAKGDVSTQMCRSGRPGARTEKKCRRFDDCAYQQQLEAEGVNVWLGAHQLMLAAKPTCFGDLGSVFSDERIIDNFISVGGKKSAAKMTDIQAVIAELNKAAKKAEKAKETSRAAQHERAAIALGNIYKVVDQLPDGEVNRRDIGRLFKNTVAHEAAMETLGTAHRGAWSTVKQADIGPKTKPENRKARINKVAEYNSIVTRVTTLIKIVLDQLERDGEKNIFAVHCVDDLINYWERGEVLKKKNRLAGGPPEPPLTDEQKESVRASLGLDDPSIIPGLIKSDDRVITGRIKEKRDGWNVPTIYMDATARESSYSAALGRELETFKVSCEKPHLTVRQVVGWRASRNRIRRQRIDEARAVSELKKSKQDDQHKTATNHQKRLARIIETRAFEFKNQGKVVDGKQIDVLVVSYKDTLEDLKADGIKLPDNVECIYFGNLTGIDKYKHVRCIIVAGSADANVRDVEAAAVLLKGDKLEPLKSAFGTWYAQEKTGIRMKGKDTGPEVKRNFHNDPIAEDVRWSMTEGELIQAIGRGREVRRTAKNPLHVDLLTDTPLPFEVDECLTWDDMQPTYQDMMIVRGVSIDGDSSTRGYWNIVAAIAPDMFPSPGAAKKKANRSRGQTHYRYIYNVNVPVSRNGEAKVRAADCRYAVPIRFTASCSLRSLFGAGAYIKIEARPGGLTATMILLGPLEQRKTFTCYDVVLSIIRRSKPPRTASQILMGFPC